MLNVSGTDKFVVTCGCSRAFALASVGQRNSIVMTVLATCVCHLVIRKPYVSNCAALNLNEVVTMCVMCTIIVFMHGCTLLQVNVC